MALETNLNQSPYFDDFNENKNFHRVLFRPGYAVQARELTQLQTILQNQIERFADEILLDGTVITGVNLFTDTVQYVKLRDKDANNRVVLLTDFFSNGLIANAIVTGETSGVTAQLLDAKEGSEAGTPNFFSIFVNYTNSGTSGTAKTFSDNESLVVTTRGQSRSAGFIVAANTITTAEGGATGKGLRAHVGDGIIYHKGHFIRVAPQATIVSRFSTRPTSKLGFETVESLIDSNQDSSLLDNASGATNYAAPGANRLKLSPTLAVRGIDTANTTTFFSIAEIRDGVITKKTTDTVYSDLGRFIATRNYETNGNYAIDPFNVRVREHKKQTGNLGKYSDGDVNKLVVETEKGTGYVNGYRVNILEPDYKDIDKATDYETQDGMVVSQGIGNYVIVQEVVGIWNFQYFETVNLCNAVQQGITSKNLAARAQQGSTIGTAKIRGIQYDSGTPGTWNGRYRIYLFDVSMNSGSSFSDVRGLYVNGDSLKSTADIVLEASGNAKLQEAGLNRLIFPLGQGGTKTLKDATDTVDTQFVVRKAKNVDFNSGSATITIGNTATGGTETMNENPVVTTTEERNLIVVARAEATTDPHSGSIITIAGNTITGASTEFNQTKFLTTYQVGDFIRITDGANTYNERISEITSDTVLKVVDAIAVTRTGATLPHRTLFPAGYHFDLAGNGQVTSTSSQHTINLQQANLSTFSADVYYNVLRTSAVQTSKTVNKNKYVHINTSTHSAGANGPWSLGVSDAFKLVAVYKGTAAGVTSSDTDVTTHFELDTGMKDGIYDTAYLKKKSTSSLDVSSSGLLVKFHYFGRDRSFGIGFLSVDSYPIDDSDISNASAITTQEIPVYTSPTTGKRYDLRDSIDFRPIRAKTVTPSANAVATQTPSITNPSAGTTFDVDTQYTAYVPTPDENFQADVQFYLPRKDRVVVTDQGNIEVIKGLPARTPRTPNEKAGTMTIATLDIPVYPSLSAASAKTYDRQDYRVKLSLENNRRYTMKDLRAVEDRINNLEYYASLNALETSAQNKQLFDNSGLNRFKNGFFVENFDGHNNADSSKVGYRAAIDRNKTQLRPSFQRTDIGLRQSSTLSSSNMRKTGNFLTLNYTDVVFQNAKFASKLRNPVQEITFDWRGKLTLNPPMDNTSDITDTGEVQLDFQGMYNAIEQIALSTGVTGIDWGNWITTSVEQISERDNNTVTSGTITEQVRQGIQTSVSPSNQLISFGNFVENVAVRDYMRSRLVNFTGVGLRPNTRVYPYFDDELVAEYCTPTTSAFANTGVQGANLVTDSTGMVYGVFRIPNDDNLKFRIGTKRFALKDVSNTITQSTLITTSAFADYTSIGLDVTQKGASVNLSVPQVNQGVVSDSRRLSNVTTEELDIGGEGGGGDSGNDPIAQTFLINEESTTEGIMLTKVGLFFGKKSSTYGITLEVREVENGTPTKTVLPYGSKTLQASSISVNPSAADTETVFTFDSPIFLKNNTEYCFALKPVGDNDEYAVWTGELGGTDVDTGELIHKQVSTGIMFTSANDRTWTPYQKEDIKYKLYRANFTTSTGIVYAENKDTDFFNYDNITGTFQVGEKIRSTANLYFANTDGAGLAVGQFIRTKNGDANGVIRSIGSTGGSPTRLRVEIDGMGAWATGNDDNDNLYKVVSGTPTFIGNNIVYQAGEQTGFVDFIDTTNLRLNVTTSSGNFANGYIRGQVSGASARIAPANNIVMNAIVPKIPQISYANTTANWAARFTSTSGTISSSYVSVNLGEDNEIRDAEKKIYGTTNEAALSAVSSSKKTLVLRGTFSTTNTKVSPMVDLSRANAYVLENIINNSFTNETNEVGDAAMRYITKPIELADGQDAEDMKVFLTAYKPSTTDIKVYAKIWNAEDDQTMDDKDYTLLTQITAANVISDTVNSLDFKEFEYGFSANTDGDNFLGSDADNQAKLNSADNNIVSYRSSTGGIYSTYKTFAIKIVMTSGGTNLVPLVKDLRAIALQR